jgi:hypothetical protein
MDRKSRLGFAQVFHLKLDELTAVEMAGTVQGKQHAFNLVGLDRIIRQPRHVLCEQIGLGLNVGDVMLCREPTDAVEFWITASGRSATAYPRH